MKSLGFRPGDDEGDGAAAYVDALAARIEGWLTAGAELRVSPHRRLAYVRHPAWAAIITWAEAQALLATDDTLRPSGGRGPFDGYRARTPA